MKLKKIKKLIVRLHRLTGSLMALMMLVWFLSGFVLIFSEFPEIENKDFYHLRNEVNEKQLALADSVMSPSKEINVFSLSENVIVKYGKNEETISYRDNKNQIKNISETEAVKFVRDLFQLKTSEVLVEKIDEADLWLKKDLSEKYFPVYKISFSDKSKSEIYISSVNGEILQNTTSQERFLSWIGAIPHLIYFRDFAGNAKFWKIILMLISFLGILMTLSGLITGIIRLKKRKKKKLKYTPYGSRLYSIHHYLGFAFGIFAFSWVFSGFMSMNPFSFLQNDSEENLLRQKWNNKFSVITEMPGINIQENVKNIQIKKFEEEFIITNNTSKFDGTRFYSDKFLQREDSVLVNDLKSKLKSAFNLQDKNITILNEYDNYYYQKVNKKVLPVVKAEFNNNEKTVLYFDPLTLGIVKSTNKVSRLNRWLYKALHRFDFIYNHKFFWHFTIITLLLGGSSLAVTGNFFYFRKKIKHRKK